MATMRHRKPTRATHILDRVRHVDGSVCLCGDCLHCLLPANSEGDELLREIRNTRIAVGEILRVTGDVRPHRRGTPAMKTDSSEPLEVVLERARRGQSVTENLGPFYVVLSWQLSSRRLVCPTAFPTVEAALLRFVETYPQLEECLDSDFEVKICVKAATQLVQ